MRLIVWAPLLLGVVLMLLPMAVQFVLPKPDLENAPGSPLVAGRAFATAPPLRSMGDLRIVRSAGEAPLVFARRATENLHSATYHCSYDSVSHNWLTAYYGAQIPGLADYGVLSLKRIRCGYCHQRAFWLGEILRYGGIEGVAVYSLGAHVVTTFVVDGERYVADADYGIGPLHLTGGAEERRRALEAAYLPVQRDFGNAMWRMIVDLYLAEEGHYYYNYGSLLRTAEEQERMLSVQDRIESAVVAVGGALAVLALILQALICIRRRQVT
jgi:hypothetical protein